MITIIDYGLGNLASVANALNKLTIPNEIASDESAVQNAKALILPGVGAAGHGMKNLKKSKLDTVIVDKVSQGTPILGICLGMQLLFSSSEEGNISCLNLIKGNVKKFDSTLKVPQIGWNQVKIQNHKTNYKNIFKDIADNSFFYFVNSYYCVPFDKDIVAGKTEYGKEFCSVIKKDTIFGVQFHPEKSSDAGLQLLKNFWEEVC